MFTIPSIIILSPVDFIMKMNQTLITKKITYYIEGDQRYLALHKQKIFGLLF